MSGLTHLNYNAGQNGFFEAGLFNRNFVRPRMQDRNRVIPSRSGYRFGAGSGCCVGGGDLRPDNHGSARVGHASGDCTAIGLGPDEPGCSKSPKRYNSHPHERLFSSLARFHVSGTPVGREPRI